MIRQYITNLEDNVYNKLIKINSYVENGEFVDHIDINEDELKYYLHKTNETERLKTSFPSYIDHDILYNISPSNDTQITEYGGDIYIYLSNINSENSDANTIILDFTGSGNPDEDEYDDNIKYHIILKNLNCIVRIQNLNSQGSTIKHLYLKTDACKKVYIEECYIGDEEEIYLENSNISFNYCKFLADCGLNLNKSQVTIENCTFTETTTATGITKEEIKVYDTNTTGQEYKNVIIIKSKDFDKINIPSFMEVNEKEYYPVDTIKKVNWNNIYGFHDVVNAEKFEELLRGIKYRTFGNYDYRVSDFKHFAYPINDVPNNQEEIDLNSYFADAIDVSKLEANNGFKTLTLSISEEQKDSNLIGEGPNNANFGARFKYC